MTTSPDSTVLRLLSAAQEFLFMVIYRGRLLPDHQSMVTALEAKVSGKAAAELATAGPGAETPPERPSVQGPDLEAFESRI